MSTRTSRQNTAHRNDPAWTPAAVTAQGYSREYRNPFTGQTIRKSTAMTGQDWHLFEPDGTLAARTPTLTYAKVAAAA